MVKRNTLVSRVIWDTTGADLEGEIIAHESLITDFVIGEGLPALREAGELNGRVSAAYFEGIFATFIILPRQWRESRAPSFDEKRLRELFPELSINYTYKTGRDEIFRLKVFPHYQRESSIYRAIASFDNHAYIWGQFPKEPLC